MELLSIIIVLSAGVIGGIVSGLLGIGGGIVTTPFLLYVSKLIIQGQMNMRIIAGLTMTQALFGTLSGYIRHGKYRFTSGRLILYMGASIFPSALLGGIISKYVTNDVLLGVFAFLAILAAFLMFIPKKEEKQDDVCTDVKFNRILAVIISIVIGFLCGLVGQGGSFILVPIMLHILKIPTRITIGSNLGIVFFSSLAGFIGKLGTKQINFILAIPLILGVVPGAQLGGYLSKRINVKVLRFILAIVISLAALKIWSELLFGR